MPSLLYDRRPDGRVSARLVMGGKLRHLGTFDTDEEALAAVKAAKAGTRGGPRVATVAEWAGMWQRLYPGKRNAETAAHTTQMIAPFVREHGGLRLSDVTPLMAQAWAVEHPSQVRFLRLMFGKACRAGLLGLNVWKYVEIPARSTPRLPPTPEELGRLAGAGRARGGWWEHFADCVVFAAYSGLRREEVERVQTSDVLEAGRRLVVRGKRRPGEVDPRARIVAVFSPGREALLRHAPQVGRVWRAPQGGSLTQDVVDRRFKDLSAAAGVGGVTFHGLRHFCSSWLLDCGASRQDVAIQLGHIDDAGRVDTTQVQERYGHMAVGPALLRLEAATTEGVPDVADADGSAGADAGAAARGAAAGE